MDFEPQKFFIGLMDFFSILLPGAFLTFLLKSKVEGSPWVTAVSQSNGAKGWVAFLVASYVLGHFAFLLGSWLDEAYDWLRAHTEFTNQRAGETTQTNPLVDTLLGLACVQKGT